MFHQYGAGDVNIVGGEKRVIVGSAGLKAELQKHGYHWDENPRLRALVIGRNVMAYRTLDPKAYERLLQPGSHIIVPANAPEGPMRAVAVRSRRGVVPVNHRIFDHHLRAAVARYGLPRGIDLPRAIARHESDFYPEAVSPKGAKGVMQLMPLIWNAYRRPGATDIFDPEENIWAGVHFLSDLHDRFDGDERMMVAAYNAGETAVNRYGGIPPFRETRRYVAAVIATVKRYRGTA